MIGKVAGVVDYVAEDHVLIDTGGVGYVVHCAQPTLAALPAPGGRAALYTELLVREDLMQLFGFRSVAEREWHRLLTSVQGVGARAALAIIGALGQAGVSRALATGDVHAIRQAPGVGPKLAQRIVTELRGRAPETILRAGAAGAAAMPGTGGPVPGPEGDSPPAAPAAQMAAPPAETPADCGTGVMAEALSALLNLGYDRGEAAAAVAEAAAEVTGGAAGPAPLIRAALRRLAREL